jgi:uncharacterized protein (TIGR03790 family)
MIGASGHAGGMSKWMMGLLWLVVAAGLRAAPIPESVAVLYNSDVPQSAALARSYAAARAVPEANLIGLPMPQKAEISRAEYDDTILRPLRQEFDQRGWWKLGMDADKVVLPIENRIRVLVVMRGVPLKIAAGPPPAAADPKDPLSARDDASVDSELAMFGVAGLPMTGVLKNMFFESKVGINVVQMPFLVLTARIDAASWETCERMIADAVAVEKNGLWGMAYVDIANKFPQGDQWLRGVAKASEAAGVATVVDRFDPTLPLNYPMSAAAAYYGWYDEHPSGPFLNPDFRFRRGAVAVHLHSFSAAQLSDATQNWCAPLLEKGAAVTVGNVYEPYLHLTHHLDTLHQRLLEGYSWVEAAWMAMPVASWQGVVLGDPLYRPFARMDGSGEITEADVDYRALRSARLEWPEDPAERHNQLAMAAERTGSAVFEEALGLELGGLGLSAEATDWFVKAKARFDEPADKIRQAFHLAAIHRAAARNDLAAVVLREARAAHPSAPEAAALAAWLDLVAPAAGGATQPQGNR